MKNREKRPRPRRGRLSSERHITAGAHVVRAECSPILWPLGSCGNVVLCSSCCSASLLLSCCLEINCYPPEDPRTTERQTSFCFQQQNKGMSTPARVVIRNASRRIRMAPTDTFAVSRRRISRRAAAWMTLEEGVVMNRSVRHFSSPASSPEEEQDAPPAKPTVAAGTAQNPLISKADEHHEETKRKRLSDVRMKSICGDDRSFISVFNSHIPSLRWFFITHIQTLCKKGPRFGSTQSQALVSLGRSSHSSQRHSQRSHSNSH